MPTFETQQLAEKENIVTTPYIQNILIWLQNKGRTTPTVERLLASIGLTTMPESE